MKKVLIILPIAFASCSQKVNKEEEQKKLENLYIFYSNNSKIVFDSLTALGKEKDAIDSVRVYRKLMDSVVARKVKL